MAGIDRLPIQEHRARPALAAVTGTLGPGQIEVIAEHVKERCAVVDFAAMLLPIYVDTHP